VTVPDPKILVSSNGIVMAQQTTHRKMRHRREKETTLYLTGELGKD